MAIIEGRRAEGHPAAASSRPWHESRFLFPVLILLIVVGFYWKLTLTKQYDWVWGPDLSQQVLPWLEEQARQVQHHELPLWDPHTWDGAPMLGQAQPGTAYPLNWILFLIPRFSGHIPMQALQWYYIIIHYMAALFCFLLCRDLGCSRAAALLGGLAFSLAGYVGTTDWPQMVNGAVWAPLVFMFLLRAIEGRRPIASAALCGTFLGMAWLAGHHQVPIYTTLAMSFVWLYHILRRGRIDWELVKLAAICFVFMGLVGALQILPADEYGHLAKRWAGGDHELTWNEAVPYIVHQEYALYPMSLLAILIPGLNRHADPFIGVVAFSLVLFAVALGWRKPAVKVFGAVALGGLVYALGHNSVFHGFLYAVLPMVDKARVPSMAVIIFNIGAAVLAAIGVDAFARSLKSEWAERLSRAVFGFALVIYGFILLALCVNKMNWEADDRIAVTAFVTLLLGVLLYGWRVGNLSGKAAFTLIIMLMLLEMGNDSGYTFPHRSDKERRSYIDKVWSNKDIADWLHQQPVPFRVETETEALVPNWAEYYNMDAIKALCASVTINVMDTEWHTWQTRLLFNVRYTVSEKPPLGDSREMFGGNSGLKVYENPGAFPRAWAVHEVEWIKDPAAGRQMINDHLDLFHTKAFTFDKKAVFQKTCAAADNVTFKKYTAERLDMQAEMACDGMVVLSDTYYPGWKATVDGKQVPIQEVNVAMRGVLVPQGAHQLTMKFRPGSIYLGFALTLLGWAGAIGLAVFGTRFESAQPRPGRDLAGPFTTREAMAEPPDFTKRI